MRGLERGLRVLEALEAQPISSLHDLHLVTGIPKPSLLRVLPLSHQHQSHAQAAQRRSAGTGCRSRSTGS
jgi:hypothetical protein